jgi:hypothetical protein
LFVCLFGNLFAAWRVATQRATCSSVQPSIEQKQTA